jgi:hypothetical protein
MLAEAARYQPDVGTAYQAIAISRIADLLGERYPQATHDQLLNAAATAMRQNQVPPDIHSAFADEMRHFFRRAGGNPQALAQQMVQTAELRGYGSQRQRSVIAEQERRAAQAKADAERGPRRRSRNGEPAWHASLRTPTRWKRCSPMGPTA